MKMVGARGALKKQLKSSGARFHSASSFRYVKHLRAEFTVHVRVHVDVYVHASTVCMRCVLVCANVHWYEL